MMRLARYLFVAIFLPLCSSAQVTIKAGTTVAIDPANPPVIVIQSPGHLANGGTFDFEAANLFIDLIGGDQTITGNWNARGLRLSTAGNKTLNGNLTVTQALDMQNGVVIPQTGKFLYTGATENLTVGDAAYVKGAFYQVGAGNRVFPVGTTQPTPLRFVDLQTDNEVGVEAIDASPALLPDIGMLGIIPDRYWEITTADPLLINSPVTLSLNGITIPVDGAPAVVQATATGTLAINLGNSSNDEVSVTSREPVTAPVVGIATTTEIVVKIRDLITPFGSTGVNDGLYIENIDRFSFNTVTLLDRWGVVVKKWENYRNDIEYDFGKLSPGNYICIAEYGETDGNTQKQTQMVTVLKTN